MFRVVLELLIRDASDENVRMNFKFQEFFFDNVTLEDLDTKSVSVAAYHQGSAKLGKDILIGEAIIPLREIRELNTKKEIKVIEEIKTQIPKVVQLIFQIENGRLEIGKDSFIVVY